VCFFDYYIALEIRSGQKVRLSLPIMSRTPRASFRAMMRNPSRLISCIQPGPAGGSLAGLGKHDGTEPALRRRAGSSMGLRGGKQPIWDRAQ